MTPAAIAAEVASANGQSNKVIAITLRELGPVIKLLASLALIDGGTEVVFQFAEYVPPAEVPIRAFTVHWQNSGPGVIKSVRSLSRDMQAALVISLQPSKLRE